jgi:hypothetical protein
VHSSLYGKIEKARRYAQEPDRIRINALDLSFHGEHDAYRIALAGDAWSCSCHTFEGFGMCAHIMAVQRMYDVMLSSEARTAPGREPFVQSALIGKIEKARRYAQQPERARLHSLDLAFHGEHDEYHLSLQGDDWRCSCHSFETFGLCAHIMAVQRLFEPMLTAEARTTTGLAPATV